MDLNANNRFDLSIYGCSRTTIIIKIKMINEQRYNNKLLSSFMIYINFIYKKFILKIKLQITNYNSTQIFLETFKYLESDEFLFEFLISIDFDEL